MYENAALMFSFPVSPGSGVLYHRWGNSIIAFQSSGHSLPILQSAGSSILSQPIYYHARALKSVPNTDTVAATDESYGHKEVISVNPRLYGYLLANVREPKILRELREETATMRGSQMQVLMGFPDQAQLLAMLVRILGAKGVLKLESTQHIYLHIDDPKSITAAYGMILPSLLNSNFLNNRSNSNTKIRQEFRNYICSLHGYSSLAVALVLPEGGQLVACERDANSLEVAQRYYDRAGVSKKVIVKHGLAADSLRSMIQNGEGSSYDFAFVDAEKKMYQDYFELLLQLVRVGGVIVMDNVLWHGRIADPLVNDSKTVSIRNFNKRLMEDDRVSISMVPIGDGMTICQKR